MLKYSLFSTDYDRRDSMQLEENSSYSMQSVLFSMRALKGNSDGLFLQHGARMICVNDLWENVGYQLIFTVYFG
jgi:hypothetical protein